MTFFREKVSSKLFFSKNFAPGVLFVFHRYQHTMLAVVVINSKSTHALAPGQKNSFQSVINPESGFQTSSSEKREIIENQLRQCADSAYPNDQFIRKTDRRKKRFYLTVSLPLTGRTNYRSEDKVSWVLKMFVLFRFISKKKFDRFSWPHGNQPKNGPEQSAN